MTCFSSSAFWQGFRVVMPLWLVAPPFALAYTAAARTAGLSPLETQLMSLTVYSASAQLGMVQLFASGASALPVILTAIVLNLHHFLYGLSLTRVLRFSPLERLAAAYMMTDGAYGVTIAEGRKSSVAFLLGAELSVFLAWNACTALALWLGQTVLIPASAHLDFAAPLTFLILLVCTVRTRSEWIVAVLSALAALVCFTLGFGSSTVLIVGLSGALLAAWWTRDHSLQQEKST